MTAILPRSIHELADAVENRRNGVAPFLVGIDGRGGSGKSTLARSLGKLINNSTVLEFDDFYRPSATRLDVGHRDIGGNFEWRRLREQVLRPLSAGHAARYQRYDWVEDALAEWHTTPARGAVIIEGNYSTRAELRDFYGFRIWVHAPRDLGFARGVARGGADTAERWLQEWMPEEERYLSGSPWRYADVIVDASLAEEQAAGTIVTLPRDDGIDRLMRL
jgi:uridine kinase